MIDITIDNNKVDIENKVYHSFNNKDTLTDMIKEIIDKCKYSGESITLWKTYYDYETHKEMKKLIGEW